MASATALSYGQPFILRERPQIAAGMDQLEEHEIVTEIPIDQVTSCLEILLHLLSNHIDSERTPKKAIHLL